MAWAASDYLRKHEVSHEVCDLHDDFFLVLGAVECKGETVLVVRNVDADEPAALTFEELTAADEAGSGPPVLMLLPEGCEVEDVAKSDLAAAAGIDLAALATARQSYQRLLSAPGKQHLRALGEALSRVW